MLQSPQGADAAAAVRQRAAAGRGYGGTIVTGPARVRHAGQDPAEPTQARPRRLIAMLTELRNALAILVAAEARIHDLVDPPIIQSHVAASRKRTPPRSRRCSRR
jgi:hypothetical protein